MVEYVWIYSVCMCRDVCALYTLSRDMSVQLSICVKGPIIPKQYFSNSIESNVLDRVAKYTNIYFTQIDGMCNLIRDGNA